MNAHHWTLVAALVVAAVAAWTDMRTGEIPNRVTLVPLALAPFVHAGIAYGVEHSAWAAITAAGSSLLGAAVCLLIPLALFRVGAIGGGDTKLFAAVGAIGRPEFGVHAETYAFVLGMLYAVALVIQRGRLGPTLGNVVAIFRGAARSPSRTDPAPADMTEVRFGPAILAGVTAAAFMQSDVAMSTKGAMNTKGAITTEYAILVGLCTIVISVAIAALGAPLVTGYNEARTILISSVP